MRDRDEHGRAVASRDPARRRQVRAEVHDGRRARAASTRELCDATAVREHEPRRSERALDHRRPASQSRRGVQHVAAVHRGDERCAVRGQQRGHAPPRVARGDRVVGVHHLIREAAAHAPQGVRERGCRPRAPAGVRALAWRRHVRDVAHSDPVAHLLARLGQQRRESAGTVRERSARRHEPVQDEHPHIRARVDGRARLPVGPDPEHRVAAARIELREDEDPHQRRCLSSVARASSAAT